MEKVLEVKNLVKRFGQNEVLSGVDFTLEKGEVLTIIGSSGGGKTTLLRALNFLEVCQEGEISITGEKVFYIDEGGKPVISEGAQKKIGLVFQQFNLFPQYSVLDNLTLPAILAAKRSMSRKEYRRVKKGIKEKIECDALNLLRSVGLYEKRDAYPCYLSGGQCQRVAIARALMLSPDILCFDEPTSALDPELTGEVLKVIKALKGEGRTMIVVTHELEFALGVADKVIFMSEGKIEEEGTAEEVLKNPKSEKTRAFIEGFKSV